MDFIRAADVVAIVLVWALVELFRRFGSPQQFPVTVEWIDELSVERYRPMLRLLNQEDVHFLRTQPVFCQADGDQVPHSTLSTLPRVFEAPGQRFRRICSALKVLIVQSRQDRPDPASLLLRNQITFTYRMMMVQARLACYRHGFGNVDVTGLVKLFDGMRLELRTLVPAELGAGA